MKRRFPALTPTVLAYAAAILLFVADLFLTIARRPATRVTEAKDGSAR